MDERMDGDRDLKTPFKLWKNIYHMDEYVKYDMDRLQSTAGSCILKKKAHPYFRVSYFAKTYLTAAYKRDIS